MIEGEAAMGRALFEREKELLFRLNVVEKLMNTTGCLLKQPEGSWRSNRFSKEELAAIKSLRDEIAVELKNWHGINVDAKPSDDD